MFYRSLGRRVDRADSDRNKMIPLIKVVTRNTSSTVMKTAKSMWHKSKDISIVAIGKMRFATGLTFGVIPLCDYDDTASSSDIVDMIQHPFAQIEKESKRKGIVKSLKRMPSLKKFFSSKKGNNKHCEITEVEDISSEIIMLETNSAISDSAICYNEEMDSENVFLQKSNIMRRAHPVYKNINNSGIEISDTSRNHQLLFLKPITNVHRSIQDIVTAVNLDVILKRTPSVDDVLSNDRMHKEIENKDMLASKIKAEAVLSRMACTQRDWVLRLFYVLLSRVFRILFDNVHVDEHGVDLLRESLKNIDPDVGVVFLPTHKSHVDYLVLSYIAGVFELPVPTIAAGDNLDIPVIGSLFRNSGAFFMKRQLDNDVLYRSVLESYVEEVLKNGATLEFFIEGGRSRDGSVLPPKYGLLNVILSSLKEKRLPDVLLVPIAVDYEHCPDLDSYIQILQGAPKTNESLWVAIMGMWKFLWMRCGDAFVTFGSAVSLKEMLNKMERETTMAIDTRSEVKYVGAHVCRAMRNNCVMTCSNIVASALLCFPVGNTIPREKLERQIDQIVVWLEKKKALFGNKMTPSSMIDHFMHLFYNSIKTDDSMYYVEATENSELSLLYYRNGLLHYFLDEALPLTVLFMMTKKSNSKILRICEIMPYFEIACHVANSHIPFLSISSLSMFELIIENNWLKVNENDEFAEFICIDSDFLSFCESISLPLLWSLQSTIKFIEIRMNSISLGEDIITFTSEELSFIRSLHQTNKSIDLYVANTQMINNSINCLVSLDVLKKTRNGKSHIISFAERCDTDTNSKMKTVRNMLCIL